MKQVKVAILGGGNIGLALAKGLVVSKKYTPGQITITRRNKAALAKIEQEGFHVTDDNQEAVAKSDLIVIAVLPQQLNDLLKAIKQRIDAKRHVIVSVVSGVSSGVITKQIGKNVEVVRAMPNTAIAIRDSMTCIAASNASKEHIALVKSMFDTVGNTVEISEEMMTPATALCACGIAFFLRAIRAASQGGIEIGFHADEALRMAAQTAKGAAALLLVADSHPEREIDKVTSPKGCTITGLNEMEHQGFSSALIKGIKTSAIKASELYSVEK